MKPQHQPPIAYIRGAFDNPELATYAAYCDNRIALYENIPMGDFRPVRLESVVAVVVVDGQADVTINGNAYHGSVNDLFILPPHAVVEHIGNSADLKMRGISLSKDYIDQIATISAEQWDLHRFLSHSPQLHLTAEEAGLFLQYYNLLLSKLTTPIKHYQQQLIDALLQAFAYEFRNMMERFAVLEPQSYRSSDRLFNAFIDLLYSSYPKPRAVGHYATRLYVTPKYLSAVCKEVSGKTASALIHQYVLNDVVYLLKRRDTSIKEVAHELDFPSLSFFGKYVKKHLGCSPKHYRRGLGLASEADD